MNTKLDLWVEKYRPDTLDGYVFKNPKMEAHVREWVANPKGLTIPIPHLLLSGVQGTGKTTLAKALVNVLGVAKGDFMEINASRENNVDVVREKIFNFCSTWALGTYKIILLDEVDGFSQAAQKILRAEIEKHSDSVRFILTCNYPNKILPALHSRLQGFHLDALDMENYITRLMEILALESIEYDPADLESFVSSAYPDLRKAINLLSQHVLDGKLLPLEEASSASFDYLEEAVLLFRDRKYVAARKLITSQARAEDYEDIYRYFYQNLDLFSTSQDGQDMALITIAKGLRNHALVADPEINLASCIVELSQIEA